VAFAANHEHRCRIDIEKTDAAAASCRFVIENALQMQAFA
jgi:hypothetical protein